MNHMTQERVNEIIAEVTEQYRQRAIAFDLLREACEAAEKFIETGENPARGCVAAPTAEDATLQVLRAALAAARETT